MPSYSHRQTVCDRAKQQAAAHKERLYEVIQKVMEDGGIAVTPDMWTDEFNMRAYAYPYVPLSTVISTTSAKTSMTR